MKLAVRRHRASRSVAFGALLVAFISACSSKSSEKGTKPLDNKDAGAKDSGAAPAPAEWTMMGYDAEGTYHNTKENILSVKNVDQLVPLWEKSGDNGSDTFPGTSNGSPVVVGNKAFVLTSAFHLYAYDLETGDVIWDREEYSGNPSLAYSDGMLYMNGNGATVIGIDAETGDQVWSQVTDTHPQASALSSPIVAGDYVVIGSASIEESLATANATFRGAVMASDKKTGDVKFKRYTAEPPYNGCAVWSTVAVDLPNNLVFAGTGNNYTEQAGPTSDSIFAIKLDSADGEVAWQKQATTGDVFTILNPKSPDTDFGANPVIFDYEVSGTKRKLVAEGQKSGDFWCWDRLTGEEVWHRKLGPGSAFIGGVFLSGAFDGEHILVVSNGATSEGEGSVPKNGDSGSTSVLFALDPASGDIVYERQLGAYVWGPITVANGVGYVGIEQTLQAFDVSNGKVLFEYKVTGTITAPPVVTGGKVLFPSGMTYFQGHKGMGFHVLGLPK